MTHELVDVVISGLSSGSTYAMMALGMALVYGISRVFNFAYGSFYSLGGYLAWLFLGNQLGYPIAFACVIPGLFFIGIATERFTLRPLRKRRNWEMLAMMSTLGLALFMDNLYLATFGPFAKSLPVLFKGTVNAAGFVISMQDIATTIIAISIIIGLWFFLSKSREGLAMRAVAQDMIGSEIVGIAKDRVFSYTFGIATVLVGIGGILLSPKYFVSPLGGWEILVKAWVITAFGGMGSLEGAVYAAFILGMVEAFVAWQLGLTWTLFIWFIILIVMFIVRPQGLRGSWG